MTLRPLPPANQPAVRPDGTLSQYDYWFGLDRLVRSLSGFVGVPATRKIETGDGLTGGGDLSADRTISVTFGTIAGTVAEGDDARIVGAAQTSSLGSAAFQPTTAFDASGAAAAAITAHLAASDPHPQYLTATEGNAAYQPLDSDLTAIAALTTASYGRGFLTYSTEALFKTGVHLTIGADVQAYSATLTTWAGKTPPSGTVVGTTDTQTLTNKNLAGAGNVFPTRSGGASFSATNGGTAQTGIASATATKITFTTEEYDNGGFYDATNSKWVPPAGLIQIILAMRITGGLVDGSMSAMSIRKNGVALKQYRAVVSNSASGEFSQHFAIQDVANGTDYYEAFLNLAGTGTKTVDGLVSATFFQGTLLF